MSSIYWNWISKHRHKCELIVLCGGPIGAVLFSTFRRLGKAFFGVSTSAARVTYIKLSHALSVSRDLGHAIIHE